MAGKCPALHAGRTLCPRCNRRGLGCRIRRPRRSTVGLALPSRSARLAGQLAGLRLQDQSPLRSLHCLLVESDFAIGR